MKANPDDSTPSRARRRRTCARAGALLLLACAAANADEDGLAERLAACAACHGDHGEGTRGAQYYPHLAGKPADYLFEQLAGFRDGLRANAQMIWYVRFADDAWLRSIAEHYAALPPRTAAADTGAARVTDERRMLAEALVERGDATRHIPACSACHGPKLAGLEPGIPALVSLPADYIAAQLGAWRAGARHATAPDCMREVAIALSTAEIAAVATWLSQQSNPEGRRPDPAGSFLPPRPCGNLPHADAAP